MNKRMYLNMILGTIGSILIAVGGIHFSMKYDDYLIYGTVFFGFALTMGYINYFEEK